jgi:hypothetical protein
VNRKKSTLVFSLVPPTHVTQVRSLRTDQLLPGLYLMSPPQLLMEPKISPPAQRATMADSQLFQELAAAGDRIVRDTPKMDLASYINSYDGFTRLLRLQMIAMTSPNLSNEAFRLALGEIKAVAVKNKGCADVNFYLTLVEAYHKLAPNEPLAQIDSDWMEEVTGKSQRKTDQLEKELKAYKNNLIKESIRVSAALIQA